MIGFYVASAAMVVGATALLVVPVRQHAQRNGSARHALPLLPLLLMLGLPLGTAGLYRLVGTPDAMANVQPQRAAASALAQPGSAASASGMTAAVEQTPAPDSQQAAALQALTSWMQQAKAHEQENRPAEARDAYAQALQLAPDNSAAIVGWVASDMATRADFAIDASSRARLQQVVAAEPDNQRGLWLLGISDFQQHDYAAATDHWQHLHGLLDTGSPMQQAVADKIAVAQSLASARQSKAATR
ncbi:tetratricopeptide repeat protein [Xanthomonas campestris pv. campestris]|uniref:tetratricopeptide repeat protein n=1 Tax=Xanthomonas campestris TaxID=339 RepID=UPI002269A4EB|nr:tetratricopeptide repeat protein [Xanthomonas campestris]MEB1347668.1 tetratricopeptide repeat protein [Xanthomonas campestris pv. campestris]MEB1794545.1 tetratricopeptide repeat protein [Xanthomonas campestris pv. campestris]WDK51195.1 tetratricopeptide repeat protein [Xanthomonas campestris pv. campestris]WDK52559.1 tetratricopeptide repeat protein [Xanthomonas campestris pv. campestris]WDL61385.1 tetratricopeptide repeat protein [Xanthomonas campestris pv. campestris]